MNQTQDPALTPLMALGVLIGVIAVLLGFVGLVVLFGVTEIWAGFLFLLYWGGIHKLDMSEFPHAAVGSLFGLILVFLSHDLGPLVGLPTLTLPLFLCVICVLVYFQILGKLHIFNNLAAMLFLTVGTIPLLADVSIIDIAKGIVLSILYFGAIGWLGATLVAKKKAKSVADA